MVNRYHLRTWNFHLLEPAIGKSEFTIYLWRANKKRENVLPLYITFLYK